MHAKMTGMKVEVDCYSGYKADERPVRFRLDGHEYLVGELLDQWYGQNELFFKLRADDGNLYILSREYAACRATLGASEYAGAHQAPIAVHRVATRAAR